MCLLKRCILNNGLFKTQRLQPTIIGFFMKFPPSKFLNIISFSYNFMIVFTMVWANRVKKNLSFRSTNNLHFNFSFQSGIVLENRKFVLRC